MMRLGGDRLGALSAFEWLLALGVVSALVRRACEREEHHAAAMVLALGAPVLAFQIASAKEDLFLLAASAAAAACLLGEGGPAELAAAGAVRRHRRGREISGARRGGCLRRVDGVRASRAAAARASRRRGVGAGDRRPLVRAQSLALRQSRGAVRLRRAGNAAHRRSRARVQRRLRRRLRTLRVPARADPDLHAPVAVCRAVGLVQPARLRRSRGPVRRFGAAAEWSALLRGGGRVRRLVLQPAERAAAAAGRR